MSKRSSNSQQYREASLPFISFSQGRHPNCPSFSSVSATPSQLLKSCLQGQTVILSLFFCQGCPPPHRLAHQRALRVLGKLWRQLKAQKNLNCSVDKSHLLTSDGLFYVINSTADLLAHICVCLLDYQRVLWESAELWWTGRMRAWTKWVL